MQLSLRSALTRSISSLSHIGALQHLQMIEPAALSNITIIPAGTLVETSWLKLTREIYCDDAQSWVQLGGGKQRFPKMHCAKA
jgi:hypothetical protein